MTVVASLFGHHDPIAEEGMDRREPAMQNSTIEWCHHTFNPWRGCTKVSAGCTHCYADTLSRRNPGVLGVWGPHGQRIIAAESYWQQPIRWNNQAKRAGERQRVLCSSLADVFEEPDTMPGEAWDLLCAARDRLWKLFEETPHLDWLLLTKRPQHINVLPWQYWRDGFPVNLWLGTSIENQETADERIPHLLEAPAVIRFLSCEPVLGPIDLSRYLASCDWCGGSMDGPHDCYNPTGLDWIIVGGERGAGARPMHPDWARSLRDQCQEARVAFFLKQWGAWHPDCCCGRRTPCRTIPRPQPGSTGVMFRCGKGAGRLLDGREWNEIPSTK